jgi:uridine kinase
MAARHLAMANRDPTDRATIRATDLHRAHAASGSTDRKAGNLATARDDVLAQVADRLSAHNLGHPVRVGIDGVCGVGKSTFAADLAEYLAKSGRSVIRLDSDGFHHLRSIRHRRREDPARGYYEDAYDFDSLRDLALVPLGPAGSRRYVTRVHDLASDAVVRDWASAPIDAIALFDATFLQREDLRDYWDEVIYLDAQLERAQARGTARDQDALGGPDQAVLAYQTRYMAACRLYLTEQNPRERASVVIEYDDPGNPRLVRG